jgi:hypothetical protein
MRDILDKLAFLTESTGLANRKPGDIFKNSAGDQITFGGLAFTPSEGGKLDSDQLEDAIAMATSQAGDIEWQNDKSARSGGFAIATFDSGTGPLYFGFFLQEVKPNPTDNKIKNIIGDYRYAGAAAVKTQAKMSPQDLLTNKLNLSIRDIMLQLSEQLGTDSPLYYIAHQVATGASYPITVKASKDLSFTGFRDYFCEILHPIALQTGNFTGNATEAAERFFGVASFKDTTISFDSSKNAGLSDSVLELPDGRYVKVSSKGETGADASVKNLLDEISNVQDPKILKEYSDIIELIETIKSNGQAGAPLVLGIRYGIISNSDASSIQSLKGKAPISLKNVEKVGLSKKLVKLAKERNTKRPDSVALYYHLMAAVAHKVAEKINADTNFSESASKILNNGALVQVYTKAKQTSDTWILDEFEAHYPSKAVTGVLLRAGKNYSSTEIKGNFAFKILRNGAKADPEPTEVEQATDSAVDTDLVKAAEKITQPKALSKKKTSEPSIGRSKRPQIR